MRLTSLIIALPILITVGCDSSSITQITETPADQVLEETSTIEPTGEQDTTSSTDTSTIQAMYSGATFASTDSSVPGVVRFTADEVYWTQSDITNIGTYSNNGDPVLVAAFADGDVSFSADGGNITWDSTSYQRAARFQFDSQEGLAAFVDGSEYRSVDELPGGETSTGVPTATTTWSLRFEGDQVFWATRDTIAIGSYTYLDGSTFITTFGASVVPVVMLENDQIMVSGSVYEKDFSNQFDSTETLISFLDGASYESVTLRDIGPSVGGISTLGRWKIDFSNDTFQWFYQDVAEAGTIAYVDNYNFTAVLSDREYTIEVDGNDIVWDNTRYSRVSN